MKLTNEQAQRVIDHISHASERKPIICPICGRNQWSVNNVVTIMNIFNPLLTT